MTYIISTHNSRGDKETFDKVGDLIGGHPDGLIALYAGTSGDGMSVTAVWETKAHSDRFTAEKLLPALQQLGTAGGPPTTVIEFETFAEIVAERAAS